MIILSLILFALCLAVLAFAIMRDLSTLRVVEPGSEDDDANTIRVAL